MSDFGKLMMWGIGAMLVIIIVIMAGSNNQKVICDKTCTEKSALGYLVIPSGKWLDLGKEDTCLCFYENHTEKIKYGS